MIKYLLAEIITDHPVLQIDGSIKKVQYKRILSEKETKDKMNEFWLKNINNLK